MPTLFDHKSRISLFLELFHPYLYLDSKTLLSVTYYTTKRSAECGLEERVKPGWYSVIAAIAAGISGAIALIQQKTDTLVGVVAALALVPALAAAGIAFLSQNPVMGLGGLLLFGINVGFIIISGIVTVIIMRPDQGD